MVEGARLLSECTLNAYRGFESLPLRRPASNRGRPHGLHHFGQSTIREEPPRFEEYVSRAQPIPVFRYRTFIRAVGLSQQPGSGTAA